MGTHHRSATYAPNLTDRQLLAELHDEITQVNGIYAGQRTYGLRCLSAVPVTTAEAHTLIAAAYDERFAADMDDDAYYETDETGFKVAVLSDDDVIRRTVEVTIPAFDGDVDHRYRVCDAAKAQVLAKVRLAKGERVETMTAGPTRATSRRVTATAPKEATVTRYYFTDGKTVDVTGPGFGSQAEARAEAVRRLTDQQPGMFVTELFEIAVVAVTKRESGAPLVTATATTKRDRTYRVDVVAVKPGAKQAGWLVEGTYHL